MAIAEKLQNIVNEKQAQIIMTNYGLPSGSKITASTKFIDYPKYIFNAFLEALRTPDTLFTNLPKKSGTGAVISLNDTANAPMRITLGASELSQAGTPTPSSPQDIHTISGSNKVVVCGKNLFDKNNYNVYNGYFIGTGTASITSESNNRIVYIPCKANTQYTASKIASKRFGIGYTTTIPTASVSVYNADSNNSGTSISISTGNDAKYLVVYIRNGNISGEASLEDIINSLQIEVGSTATTYEPYVSQEADIDLSSKNLFNPTKAITDSNNSATYRTANGEWIRFVTGPSPLKFYPESIKENTQYTFKVIYKSGVSNSNRIILTAYYTDATTKRLVDYTTTDTNEHTTTATTDSGKTLSYIQSGNTDNRETFIKIEGTMLNEGTQELPYMPYYDYGFCGSIGNYEDRIFKNIPAFSEYDSNLIEGAWYIKKNIGKVVLDGTENDWNMSTGTGRYSFWIFNTKIPNVLNTYYYKYCDNFKYYYEPFSTASIPSLCENTMALSAYPMFVFNTDGSQGTTVADWKTWLSNNNTIVYYVLKTPTYTKITGTLAEQLENVYQKLLSYSGTTNISQVNNDLSFNMSVLAIEEL